MDKSFLLLDFGASRIKTAIYKNKEIYNIRNYDAIKPITNSNNEFVVSGVELQDFFKKIVKENFEENNFDGILISSEMHGFLLVDEENKLLSDYISWKDERGLNKENFDEYARIKNAISNSFLQKTGMKFRPCYPITKSSIILNELKIECAKVISLPELFCACDNKSLNVSHITTSAGLGFYNIKNSTWDKEYLESLENRFKFNRVTHKVEIGGYITIQEKEIPIYTGFGDLQSAIMGTDYDKDSINLNLGTGSQVIAFDFDKTECEIRPFFDNHYLTVVPHIPSGRVLNVFVNFLKSINPDIDYWQELDNISLNEILNSSLDIDLNLFASAYKYKNGGFIQNITENNLNFQNLLASILKSYILQYEQIIDEFMNIKPFKKIVLNGGISNKLPVLKEYFANKYKDCNIIQINNKIDDTLIGLSRVADKIESEQNG